MAALRKSLLFYFSILREVYQKTANFRGIIVFFLALGVSLVLYVSGEAGVTRAAEWEAPFRKWAFVPLLGWAAFALPKVNYEKYAIVEKQRDELEQENKALKECQLDIEMEDRPPYRDSGENVDYFRLAVRNKSETKDATIVNALLVSVESIKGWTVRL